MTVSGSLVSLMLNELTLLELVYFFSLSKQLKQYIERLTEELVRTGDLDGMLLTGQ